MLDVKLTENYLGFKIIGDEKTLNQLHDSINYLMNKTNETEQLEIIKNHLYGFLFELRHASQGDRDISFVQNFIGEVHPQKKLSDIDYSEYNVYYSFNYFLVELVLDIVLIKCFVTKLNIEERNEYNVNLNLVDYFYSLALEALKKILTKEKFKLFKIQLSEAYINESTVAPYWFQKISHNYLMMNKGQRKSDISKILDLIINCNQYEEYKLDIEKGIDQELFNDVPDDIEW